MTRKEWNKLKDKTRYHTEEDIRIDNERKQRVWNEAEERRKQIESGTYVKPKRKYTRRSKKN